MVCMCFAVDLLVFSCKKSKILIRKGSSFSSACYSDLIKWFSNKDKVTEVMVWMRIKARGPHRFPLLHLYRFLKVTHDSRDLCRMLPLIMSLFISAVVGRRYKRKTSSCIDLKAFVLTPNITAPSPLLVLVVSNLVFLIWMTLTWSWSSNGLLSDGSEKLWRIPRTHQGTRRRESGPFSSSDEPHGQKSRSAGSEGNNWEP